MLVLRVDSVDVAPRSNSGAYLVVQRQNSSGKNEEYISTEDKTGKLRYLYKA